MSSLNRGPAGTSQVEMWAGPSPVEGFAVTPNSPLCLSSFLSENIVELGLGTLGFPLFISCVGSSLLCVGFL